MCVLKNTATGALLALGAPLGYFVYSFFILNPENISFFSWIHSLFSHQWPLLVYLTFPTMAAFSWFGYFHGVREIKLAFKTRQMEEFLHVAAHDIRSPLSIITEAASLLGDPLLGSLNTKQLDIANMIHGQTTLMLELLEELLDIHKMELGKYRLDRKPCELIPLVEKAIAEISLLIDKKKVKIETVFEVPQAMTVSIDSFRIRQVIRNLINNAIKYTPEQGTIQIQILSTRKHEIEIIITNDGSSIPREKLSVIFNKFEQARDRDHKLGYGLGLSICKNIIELHKGKIWAENLAPSGVAFHISLSRIP